MDLIKVHVFNVGQGDNIMLKFPKGEFGLIDFHYDPKLNQFEPPSLTYFKHLKSTLSADDFDQIVISFICISHTDKDHIKGLSETIEWFYINNVKIAEIWLGGSKDESEFYENFKNIINEEINELDFENRKDFIKPIELYNKNLELFFKYFRMWRDSSFDSTNYKSKNSKGKGEYLYKITQLRKPSSDSRILAYNLGPLDHHINKYVTSLNLEMVRKILGLKTKSDVDKNLLSHILRIRYGEVDLLFGGDTSIEVWEDCLERYNDTKNYNYLKTFGPIKPSFIKVSHHGSKNSSSDKKWETLIGGKKKAVLAISCGCHKRYNHPHSETIKEIKRANPDSKLIATNICGNCIDDSQKEEAKWFTDYRKMIRSEYQDEVESGIKLDLTNSEKLNGSGLLYYLIEVGPEYLGDTTIKLNVTPEIGNNTCFYKLKSSKLNDNCISDQKN